jgi:ADP-heptose:LPS heptosyltransferase
MKPHALVARLDSAGDVLLQGPAIRAVAAGSRQVTMLCGPNGADAARLLPGVDDVVVHRAEWIDPQPPPVSRENALGLVETIAGRGVDAGVILGSFHQSPLPLALLLRLAGVRRLGAVCTDYPGSLLDVRHLVDEDVHEVERGLSLAAVMGFPLPPRDDARLRINRPASLERALARLRPYVVVHPGASAPARAWSPVHHARLVKLLVVRGWRVFVTGSGEQVELCAQVAGPPQPAVHDLGGGTNLAELAEVLAGAAVVVTGNTGPAHLAAAVGTPVVSLFAPVVPASRWRPWRVPHALLGRQDAACAASRARICPVPGHPCLDSVEPEEVLSAVEDLNATSQGIAS